MLESRLKGIWVAAGSEEMRIINVTYKRPGMGEKKPGWQLKRAGDLNVFKGIEEGANREESGALGEARVKNERKHSGNEKGWDLGRLFRASL